MVGSFEMLWSTQAPTSTTLISGQSSRVALFWHRTAIALCMEKSFSVEKHKPNRAFAWDYASRVTFADKTMRADHMALIASL